MWLQNVKGNIIISPPQSIGVSFFLNNKKDGCVQAYLALYQKWD